MPEAVRGKLEGSQTAVICKVAVTAEMADRRKRAVCCWRARASSQGGSSAHRGLEVCPLPAFFRTAPGPAYTWDGYARCLSCSGTARPDFPVTVFMNVSSR